MSDRTFHGDSEPYSASRALAALGKALGEIKAQDHLTYADMGAVLGKGEDQAAKYCDGSASMDVVTFGRARKAWGSRFTGYFDRLCESNAQTALSDRQCERDMVRAVMALSECLTDDNTISAKEVWANRAALEDARDALDRQLAKLRPAA